MRYSARRLLCSSFLALILFSSLVQIGCFGPAVTLGTQQAAPAAATPYEKDVDLDLSSSSAINWGASITISNQGNDSLAMPAVFIKGDSAAFNLGSILSFIRTGGPLSDEQFALATWQFVVKNTFHYCSAGAPGDPSDIAMEPARLLNGYGFACCDQSSRILSWLWQGAGYQARIAQMSFHTVPEIYYKGAWHLYDADHKVYYLAADNVTVASVAQIIADPLLVARTKDENGDDPAGFSAQLMASLYAAAVPDYYAVNLSADQTYSLRPGESFSVQHGNLPFPIFHGPWSLPEGSYPVASGEFDWSLDFSNANWMKLADFESGVTTLIAGSNIFLANASANAGSVLYRLSSPFPVVSFRVGGLVYRSASDAEVNAYFSLDGVHWSTAFPLTAEIGGPSEAVADLTSAAAGQYTYFVKLELSGNVAYSARIADVHLVSGVQDSIFVFPTLVPGKLNHLTYQDWTSPTQGHNVAISLSGQ